MPWCWCCLRTRRARPTTPTSIQRAFSLPVSGPSPGHMAWNVPHFLGQHNPKTAGSVAPPSPLQIERFAEATVLWMGNFRERWRPWCERLGCRGLGVQSCCQWRCMQAGWRTPSCRAPNSNSNLRRLRAPRAPATPSPQPFSSPATRSSQPVSEPQRARAERRPPSAARSQDDWSGSTAGSAASEARTA